MSVDPLGLQQVVAAQIHCAERLLDTLESERLALIAEDVDELRESCARKLELSRQLQRLGERMEQLRPAPRRSLDTPSDVERIGEDWQRLRRLAERCDRANRLNGALVDSREAQLRTALAALHPQSVTQAIYGRSGATAMRFGSRLHDRA